MIVACLDTPTVHHHHHLHPANNVDCWSMMPPSMEQNNYTATVANNSTVVVGGQQQPENSMGLSNGGYCGTAAQERAGLHQYSSNNPMDSSSTSSYIYLNGSANHHHHSHHQHHQQHHSAGSKSLGGYGSDPLQLNNFHHHNHHQQQQQQHESYDSYSVDMMGADHYSENYSNSTPSSDPEEMTAPSDCATPQMMVNSSVNGVGLLKRVGRPSTTGKSSSSSSSSSSRRRKQDRGYGKLWEFIRDLLHDPKYCPSMVRWEDVNDGVFRIVQSEKLANLWGTIKNNPRMTYEKLSRAMR